MSSKTDNQLFDSPCEVLIPRETEPTLTEHFQKYSKVLDEVVNFGTHALTWEVQQLKNEEYIGTPLMLLRESLDLTDSCSILISKGAADTAKVLTRSLFELYLSVAYMCKEDIKRRSYAYMFSSVLDDIKYHKNVINYFSKHNPNVKTNLDDEAIQELNEHILEKESLFVMPGFEDAYKYYNLETERRKETKVGRKLDNWYSYYEGPNNLRELSIKLNLEQAYIFFYSKYSKAAHGNDSFLGKMVSSGENSSEMVQLRSFSNLESVFEYTFNFSTSIIVAYLMNILPERSTELESFLVWRRAEMMKIMHKKKSR